MILSFPLFLITGLSTVAMCAPSEKFLNMGGPLAMGLGVVFISSIGKVPTKIPDIFILTEISTILEVLQ